MGTPQTPQRRRRRRGRWPSTAPTSPAARCTWCAPRKTRDIPWTALLIGLWIPNFFYWGLNQYIVQRTLGSKSLAEGQKGIVFAAFLKLIIPFVVVIPGILAFNLFSGDLHDSAEKNIKPSKAKPRHRVDEPSWLQPDLAAICSQRRSPASLPTRPDADAAATSASTNSPPPSPRRHVTEARTLGYDYDAAFPVLVRNLIKPNP